MSPPCEDFLTADELDGAETFYPLNVRICESCLLVQLPAYIPADAIFTDDYAYFSSYSDSRVQHAVAIGIPSLGIEPTANTAARAIERGIPTEVTFLGADTGAKIASAHGRADLVVANNVFAHVPDIVDFACGLRELVAGDGIVSIEVPHLLRLIDG